MTQLKVAFVCTHNACRSQIAEALGRKYGSDVFVSYSAGTAIKEKINPDAVRLMKQKYGIDMSQTQTPKALVKLPPVDVVVTMGCGVKCPYLPCQQRIEWQIPDPTGSADADFLAIIALLEEKIKQLKQALSQA